jgi:hypothetical protein
MIRSAGADAAAARTSRALLNETIPEKLSEAPRAIDAPYLSPVPHRGEPNRPAWVPIVGAALAAARGSDVDEIRALTCTNATDFYAISTDTSAMPPSLPNR